MTRPDDRRPIVVGVDPDPVKRVAVVWAADEAARRRVPLRLVHADTVPTTEFRRWELPRSWQVRDQALHEAGRHVLEAAVVIAHERQPRIEVSGLLAEGNPVPVLREHSHDATAVVLGSWHLSRMREMFGSDSIALPVISHAHCPVVVVPEPEHPIEEPAFVVVGVDGSASSAAAVDFAFEEAALRGAALRALYVRHPGLLGVTDEGAAQRECGRLLSETVAGPSAAHPQVESHHEVVDGHPVKALTDASAHALALVVGTRGHGGFAGMLLGSVSQGVLRHARCPVVAVPLPAAWAGQHRP
ncbi:universal stress protein [Streptomyces chiangmaiensis]|uniref:Universal stress protein n=1 Tax=Streptomyces chiangmaiensis TaxID=766497 RepID=A0ABU7FCS9_9ACTN|nr:universal stress protein [Streptomyces chiangmaiensis]MED7821746.1 universal stress protein [Streptomyces chiangmaiensis]